MDFIIAASDAKLSCRFIKMGLVPELASSQFLVARCGLGQASELMLSGKTIDAIEAERIGLVDRVVEGPELLAAAISTARSMGENPQVALQMVKQLITQNMAEKDLMEVQRREGKALMECYKSAEHKEAISAFLEKRSLTFGKLDLLSSTSGRGRTVVADFCEYETVCEQTDRDEHRRNQRVDLAEPADQKANGYRADWDRAHHTQREYR